MIAKTFLKAVANGEIDLVRVLLSLLEETGSDYCVIGGLAVNAYAEPVTRRKSKRQKDLPDITRLAETHPDLKTRLPLEIASELD